MQYHRMIGIVIAGATLALGGCVVTAPKQTEPSVSDAAFSESNAVREESQDRVVEAEGIAYMGGEDRLKDVRRRAEHDAIKKLLQAGAPLYVEEYRRTEFATLVDDSVSEESRGILLERKVVKEGLDGNTYRVAMRARYRPVDPKDSRIEPPKRAQPAQDEVKTAHTPADSTREPPAGSPPVSSARTEQRAIESAPAEEASASIQVSTAPEVQEDTRESTPTTRVSRSTGDITVCCHNFPDVLRRWVYPVLSQIKGITRLEQSNMAYGSLCYRFHYDGEPTELEDRLVRDLRTSSTAPFRIERNRGTNLVDLVFDGGFD